MRVTNPELKIVRFGADDVIATSGYYMLADNWDIYTQGTPSGDSSNPYVHFYGTMHHYDEGAQGWYVQPQYGAGASYESQANIDNYIADANNHGYSTEYALLNGLYDAYSYGGNYYTKGASYYELYGNQ